MHHSPSVYSWVWCRCEIKCPLSVNHRWMSIPEWNLWSRTDSVWRDNKIDGLGILLYYCVFVFTNFSSLWTVNWCQIINTKEYSHKSHYILTAILHPFPQRFMGNSHWLELLKKEILIAATLVWWRIYSVKIKVITREHLSIS